MKHNSIHETANNLSIISLIVLLFNAITC